MWMDHPLTINLLTFFRWSRKSLEWLCTATLQHSLSLVVLISFRKMVGLRTCLSHPFCLPFPFNRTKSPNSYEKNRNFGNYFLPFYNLFQQKNLQQKNLIHKLSTMTKRHLKRTSWPIIQPNLFIYYIVYHFWSKSQLFQRFFNKY